VYIVKLTIGFFLALRVEDLRCPLKVIIGAVGVAVSATGADAPTSLTTSLSLAEATTSSDLYSQLIDKSSAGVTHEWLLTRLTPLLARRTKVFRVGDGSRFRRLSRARQSIAICTCSLLGAANLTTSLGYLRFGLNGWGLLVLVHSVKDRF
jgi:hypothetical protein